MISDAETTTKRAKILVVDDAPADSTILCGILQAHYEVFAAPSGERALQIAATTPGLDLILLDILMPDISGYEVLARLRDNPDTRNIPVIFVTSLNSDEDEGLGLKLGAVDYIAKPCRAPIVLARVATRLELKNARDKLAQQNAYLEKEIARRMQENQQVQLQLLQSEKMAAIGQLAAGITHEINNPVGYVSSNLGTLDSYIRDIFERLDAYEALATDCVSGEAALLKIRELKQQKDFNFFRADIPELIAESRHGLARVAKIVSDLKNFSRAENNDWLLADLHNEIESTLNIVWNELKYRCTLHKEYGDIPWVYCIPSQINQVILNLLVNAAQAIPEKGEITIRTGKTGEEVFIAVADTGTGIPPAILPRLFEPFFTTKPVGKGTGLGLSISYGIVQKHGGHIEVESTEGKGTTFTVWLPVNGSLPTKG
jgi:signal transduction histidine kinase